MSIKSLLKETTKGMLAPQFFLSVLVVY